MDLLICIVMAFGLAAIISLVWVHLLDNHWKNKDKV